MKTYTGKRGYQPHEIGAGEGYRGEAFVKVDGRPLPLRLDLANHSPTGFEWGYGGSGPAQLALAILADCLGDEHDALSWAPYFKAHVVAALPHDEWELGEARVRELLDYVKAQHPEHAARVADGRPHWLYARHVKSCQHCQRAENGLEDDWCPEGRKLFEASERALGIEPRRDA